MVDGKGIYVIEVKTFRDAKIYGDGNQTKWYSYSHNKKYEIYSPLKQNKKHIEYLKNFLKDFGDIPCFSILVVFCDDFKVTNINQPGVIDTAVCNSLPTMKKTLHFFAENNPEIFDIEKRHAIFNYIESNQHQGKEARAEHKQNIIAYKEFSEELKRQKICPYCKVSLVIRKGKYGEFYGCPNFPKCKYT